MRAATTTRIESIDVQAATIPTDQPESDGTLSWDSTTIVVVRATAAGETGLGYTYGSPACRTLIAERLAAVVKGLPALEVPAAWQAMRRAVRNEGLAGQVAMAISAVDTALWDLAARLLDVPLCVLLGTVRERVPVYGSGGFCSYDDATLSAQLGGWAADGMRWVKMKVGRDPEADVGRVRAARDAIGQTELFVDANGAYRPKEALRWAEIFADHGVTYFEEPVSSDDLHGLALVRDRAPDGMVVAAGEYGYDLPYFARMARAVDIQQADGTRCGGFTALRQIGGVCQALQLPLSLHCAPALHAHAGAALGPLVHLEYFHDHVRVENMLFDGVLTPQQGCLKPVLSRAGHGLSLKQQAFDEYRVD
jgi:L-alanine-DL-glutamate epimerase-like enolase superfamily enzyme